MIITPSFHSFYVLDHSTVNIIQHVMPLHTVLYNVEQKKLPMANKTQDNDLLWLWTENLI